MQPIVELLFEVARLVIRRLRLPCVVEGHIRQPGIA